jgi:ribose transport system ATP-binding protein
MGERQLVEICRALIGRPQVLILDEPNSALNQTETERLFDVLKGLRDQGIALLFVSHRLEEVFAIADRISVLRNGQHMLTAPKSELTIKAVVEAMIGREQDQGFPTAGRRVVDGAGISITGLGVGSELYDVSLIARPGEVVGLAGLDGSGNRLILHVLFGARRASRGTAEFPDGKGLPSGPNDAAKRGICLVPAERRRQGLMYLKPLAENVAEVGVGALPRRYPWLRPTQLGEIAVRGIESLRIKAPSAWEPVSRLSGGNQQKVVLAKWLEIAPSVILLDDPCRGVDVGSKHEIHGLIRQLADKGNVLLMTSSEIPELVGISDRVVVLYRGRVAGEYIRGEVDSPALLHAINTGRLE